MTQQTDDLVTGYLAQVARATAALPAQRRDELLRDLREHIDTERSELAEETETQVQMILERLGDPVTIAAAADADGPPAPAKRSHTWLWVVAIVATVLLVGLCLLGFMATSINSPVPSK